MPRLQWLQHILMGLKAYVYYDDHGFPHLVVRKGRGKNPEAEVKIRIADMVVLESFGFNEPTVNKIVKALKQYRPQLMEEWNEKQKR